MRLSRDSIAGLVCLALSLALLYLTGGLPRNPLVPIGPEFYPRIVLVITAVLSVTLVAADAFAARRGREVPAAAAGKRNYGLVAVTFAVFGIYVALLPLAGFRIATFIFVAALQVVLEKPRGSRGWCVVLIAAAATVAVTYLAFEVYLSVLMPRGSWTGV